MGLSEQNKLYLIGAGFLLMLIIAYNLAIKNTFELARSYRDLKEKSLTAGELPEQIAKYRKQLLTINQSYFNSNNSFDNTHELFLEKLGYIASKNGVTIIEYPQEHILQTSLVQIETHNMVLKGRFPNLLQVLYQLEVHERVGRLVSVEFFTTTNRRTKVTSLFMRVYIQNYKNQGVRQLSNTVFNSDKEIVKYKSIV